MANVSASRLILVAVVGWISVHSVAAQHVSCRTNYFLVAGDSVREIHQSLRHGRPWRGQANHDGLTMWTVNWRFSTTTSGSVCRLSTFNTTASINITLPRWVPSTNASDFLKAEWDRYIKALGQHEYGHAQIALAAAGAMHKQVKEHDQDASCENLQQRIHGLCQGIVQTHKQMDTTYDQRTEHGATQGARLGRGNSPRPPN